MTMQYEHIFPEDQQESEDDISGVIDFRDVVSMASDWTVDTLFNQVEKRNIDLDPAFQRRAAWEDFRKSRLVESIVVGMPIPNIVLAEKKDQRGKFIVIDGKQRLLAIHEFKSGGFKLSGLDIRRDLNGCTYKDLSADDCAYFDNCTIRSTLIRNWPSDEFLYAMFYRLNSGSLQLSPQELRRALVGGKLLDAIEKYLEQSKNFHRVFGVGLDRRMRDSELVLRFIAFELYYVEYVGDLKKFLDEVTERFEQNWEERKYLAFECFEKLDVALNAGVEVFGDKLFKKYIGHGKYESRVNRAIFDCVSRFFSHYDVAAKSVANKEKVVEAFEHVCELAEFKEAIEKTTKSKRATEARLNIWGGSLAGAIGMKYDSSRAALG